VAPSVLRGWSKAAKKFSGFPASARQTFRTVHGVMLNLTKVLDEAPDLRCGPGRALSRPGGSRRAQGEGRRHPIGAVTASCSRGQVEEARAAALVVR
jgi:hypothetical protein